MTIERTKSEVIFRLPASTKIEDLQALADYFSFLEIVSRSKATQSQVSTLIKEAKKGRWKKTKSEMGL